MSDRQSSYRTGFLPPIFVVAVGGLSKLHHWLRAFQTFSTGGVGYAFMSSGRVPDANAPVVRGDIELALAGADLSGELAP